MDDRPARRRLRCWGWLLILTGLVGVAAVVGALWLRSNGDLDAERVRSAALGLPQSWEALGVVRAKPADADILERLGSVAGRAVEYTENGDWGWRWDPFISPPTDLAAWDSGVDADEDGLVDQLSGEPAWAIDAAAVAGAVRDGNAHRLVEALGGETEDPHELVGDHLELRSGRGRERADLLAERLARLATTPSGFWLADHSSSLSLANSWVIHILRHRTSLNALQSSAMANQLADRLDGALISTIATQPLLWDSLLRLEPESLFRTLNIRQPDIMMYRPIRNLFHRLGREPIEARLVDAAAMVANHGAPRTWVEKQLVAPDRQRPGIMHIPREALSFTLEYGECQLSRRFTFSNLPTLLHFHLRITTALRLLAADFAGTSWPADPCDPRGLPLRPVMRDGVVIGAYGCGQDGVDDGGSQRTDWCWPLRASLGSPQASDPPKAH